MPAARTGGLAWVVATDGRMGQQMEVLTAGQTGARPGGQAGIAVARRH